MTLLSLLLIGCDSFSLYDYELDGSSAVTVAGTPVGMPLSGPVGGIEMGESDIDLESGDLADARFTEITVHGVGADSDLSFLDSLTISVAAPGLPQEVVAVSTEAFEGNGPFALELMDVDLVPYLETGAMSFPATAVGVTPESDTELAISWTVTLGITAQGISKAADEIE